MYETIIFLWSVSVRWPGFGCVDRSDRCRCEPHCLQMDRPDWCQLHLLDPKPAGPAHSGNQLCVLLWRGVFGCVLVCVCYTSLCSQPFCAGMCDIRLCQYHTRVHLQTHGWQIGNCTQKLPFMCQRKGEVNESAQSGCPAVSSSLKLNVIPLKGLLCFHCIFIDGHAAVII